MLLKKFFFSLQYFGPEKRITGKGVIKMKKIIAILMAAALTACGTEPAPISVETGLPADPPMIAVPNETAAEPTAENNAEPEAQEPEAVAEQDEPETPSYTVGEALEADDYPAGIDAGLEICEKYREALVLKMTNNTKENVDRGSKFRIDIRQDDGWHRLVSGSDIMFPALNVWMEPGETAYDVIALDKFFGEMPNGEYRVVKEFSPESDFDNPTVLCAEFVLDDGDMPKQPGIPDVLAALDRPADGLTLYQKSPENEALSGGVTLMLKNDGDEDAEFGESYRLIRKLGDRWYYVRMVTDYPIMTGVLLTAPAGSEVEIDWVRPETDYGALPAGEYGVVIPVNVAGEQKEVVCEGVSLPALCGVKREGE